MGYHDDLWKFLLNKLVVHCWRRQRMLLHHIRLLRRLLVRVYAHTDLGEQLRAKLLDQVTPTVDVQSRDGGLLRRR